MIDLLIEAGADPNTQNNWGFSPLLVGLIKKHMKCVKKMTEIPNIDVNIRDNKGRGFLFGLVFQFDRENYIFLENLIKNRGGNPV
jgi:ankyrin repeat protein